jgi:16S rRNA processing protein RimM
MEIGVVRTVNPARRELRVSGAALSRVSLRGLEWVHVEKPGEAAVRCKVRHATVRESSVTLALAAGVPRDTVAAMRGATVLIERDQTRARPAYPPADLVGLNVVTRAGETVGTVRDVMESPANDVMEIETPDRRRLLLPVIAQVIVSVEPGAGRLVVNDIAAYVVDDAD